MHISVNAKDLHIDTHTHACIYNSSLNNSFLGDKSSLNFKHVKYLIF